MDTNYSINEILLEQVLRISGLQTKNEAINLALEEFVKTKQNKTVEDVISLFNTVEYDKDYDYKKLRRKNESYR